MKKMFAALVCVCLLCAAMVGCANAPKELPITLPHDENLRFDMTKDELIELDNLEKQEYEYYQKPDWETCSFLDVDCIVTYRFSGDTLKNYTIGPMARSENYNDEYKTFVDYFTKQYGKGETISENPDHADCKDYKQTNWDITLDSGVTYHLETFTCAESENYLLLAYFSKVSV